MDVRVYLALKRTLGNDLLVLLYRGWSLPVATGIRGGAWSLPWTLPLVQHMFPPFRKAVPSFRMAVLDSVTVVRLSVPLVIG